MQMTAVSHTGLGATASAAAHASTFTPTHTTILDNGATNTCLRASDVPQLPTFNHHTPTQPTQLTFPNHTNIHSIGACLLAVGPLLIPADIYNDADLASSLLSVGQVTAQNDTCVASQSNVASWITLNGTEIFRTAKARDDALWRITPTDFHRHAPTSGALSATAVIAATAFAFTASHVADAHMARVPNWQSIAQHVAWYHACMGSPTKFLLEQATRLNYLEFPGIDAPKVRKHLVETFATHAGHLRDQRQGHATMNPAQPPQGLPNPMQPPWTPVPAPVESDGTPADTWPVAPPPGWTLPFYNPLEPSNDHATGYTYVYSRHDVMHGDATGTTLFPGANPNAAYILVMTWGGYTLLAPLANKDGATYARAYTDGYNYFKAHRPHHPPKFIRTDQETSALTRRAFADANLIPQYVPPRSHRGLKAERYLQTVKAHLLSCFHSVSPDYPAAHWAKLLPQIQLTLNILVPSKANPAISAYEWVHGHKYDFHHHPFGPPGCSVLAHVKVEGRASFDDRASTAWYLGPTTDGTRLHAVLSKETLRPAQSNQLVWQPHQIQPPRYDHHTAIAAAIHDLRREVRLLRNIDDLSPYLRASIAQITDAFDGPLCHADRATLTTTPGLLHDDGTCLTCGLPPHAHPSHNHAAPAAPADIPAAFPPPPAPVALAAPPAAPPLGPAPARRSVSFAPGTASAPDHPTASNDAPTRAPAIPQRVGPPAPPQRVDPPASRQRVDPVNTRARHRRATAAAVNASNTEWYRAAKSTSYPTHTLVIPTPPVIGKVLRNATLDPSDIADWHEFWAPPMHPTAEAHAAERRALNVDENGKPLTPRSAFNGPDRATWTANGFKEVNHLFDADVFEPTQPADLLPTDVPGHYHPVVREKYKLDQDGVEQLQQRVRGTHDNRRAPSPYPVTHHPANLTQTKVWYNKVASEPHRINFTADLKDMYIMADNPHRTFLWMDAKYLDAPTIAKYQLAPFIHSGRVLLRLRKCLFGMPDAGALAKLFLDRTCLNPHGYWEDPLINGVYRHRTNGTEFLLVTDDFNVLCNDQATKDHLLTALRTKFEVTIDHQGTKWLGCEVSRSPAGISITIPGAAKKITDRFAHRNLVPCDSPMIYTPPDYKSKTSQDVPSDSSATLTDAEYKEAQQIIGACGYYAQVTEAPILTAVNALQTELPDRKASINPKLNRLLGYLLKYPNNALVYKPSGMVYHCASDVSYLSVTRARSRAGGHGFFGYPNAPTFLNGPVCAMSKVLDVVVSSAAEGEYGAAYLIAREAVYIRACATAMGYPQHNATILLCDNSTAVGLANDNVKIAKTKAIDMRYHWLRDRVRQGQFRVEWVPKNKNIADFFTKALPVHVHRSTARWLVRIPTTNPKRLARTANWLAKRATAT